MDRDTWVSHYQYSSVINPINFDSFSDVNDEINKEIISVDSNLPDDLLERILAFLPVASIFRASCVCKRWHDIVTSKRFQWNFSVHVLSHNPWYFMFTSTDESFGYSFDPSVKKWMWTTTFTEVLNGWRAGDESVICDGVLYFLLYSTGSGLPDNRHGLIKYNLSNRLSRGLLMRNFIPAPCSLTCGRLMNLKEKLVMVGGIGKQDRSDIIKGIGIWILKGNEWQEVARMPHKYFQGFGEFDDVFASSGTEDLIYIQSYGAPALLLFNMNQKQWK